MALVLQQYNERNALSPLNGGPFRRQTTQFINKYLGYEAILIAFNPPAPPPPTPPSENADSFPNDLAADHHRQAHWGLEKGI